MTETNLFDVDDDSFFYSTDNVTATNNVAAVIDIYFVRRIGDRSGLGEPAGTTIFEGSGFGRAGILVARETTGNNNSVQTRDLQQMARTLAHEMGHYLLKSPGHSSRAWNIMFVDSDNKLDIDKDGSNDQVATARLFTPVD